MSLKSFFSRFFNKQFKEALHPLEQPKNLPRYLPHPYVLALKIATVIPYKPRLNVNDSGNYIAFEDRRYLSIDPGREYFNKYKVTGGGYYLVFPDGKIAFSGAQEFRDSYTPVSNDCSPHASYLPKEAPKPKQIATRHHSRY